MKNLFAFILLFLLFSCSTEENDPGQVITAMNDEVKVVESQTMVFKDLSLNDEVPKGILISEVGNASHGEVKLLENGSVSYTPDADFVGDDSFSYSICSKEGSNCDTAQVTVHVLAALSLQVPEELEYYYSDLILSSDGELNHVLLGTLTSEKQNQILEYYQRHDFLYDADEDPQNPDNVILMYSGESRYWEEYESPSNTYQPQTFNTEHIYPQSLLKSDLAVTDLHHLRVVDSQVNSERSNHPYTDDSGDYHLVNGNAWYPGDEWIGDVARMVFYLNIRYNEDFYKIGGLQMFLEWNREDPVSEFEIQRNNIIEAAQGNRNPFIDNPYLANLIWGGEPAEDRWGDPKAN